jgi:prevent-host-death family protein
MKVAIREAKNNLSKYGNLANEGNKITVCKNGKPWFDLVPHQASIRSTAPLNKAKPTVNAAEATAPVDPRDIAGWI